MHLERHRSRWAPGIAELLLTSSAKMSALVSKRRPESVSFHVRKPFEFRDRVERQLARDLAKVVSEPILDIARLVEAACHQRFDPILGSGPPQ